MSVEPQNIIRLITSQLKFDYISKSNESGYKLIAKDGISLNEYPELYPCLKLCSGN